MCFYFMNNEIIQLSDINQIVDFLTVFYVYKKAR